jgi:sugar/nucleoside kinase (ribokinase family)
VTPPQWDAVVAGHICLDIHPDLSGLERKPFEEVFLPGRLIATGPVSVSTGGPVSNTGLALNRLGIAACLVGKIGDDLFGKAVCEVVASRGGHLTEGMVVDASTTTSYTIIISYPGVDRIFLHNPGANDTFQASDVPYALLEQVRLFHFGYPPLMRSIYANQGAQLEEIFRRAKETGVTTSLDMAFPDASSEAGRADWGSILKSVLPYVDIFMPSVEEIFFMLRRATYQKLCAQVSGSAILPRITPELLSELGEEILAMGVKILGLKLGDRGLYLRTGRAEQMRDLGRARPSEPEAWAAKEMWAPCFEVKVAGTTGSGDATIAGFLTALLHDLSIEEALISAVAVGACNVEAADALSGIRTWEETTRRIACDWERHTLDLNSPGWKFDALHHIWRGPCLSD